MNVAQLVGVWLIFAAGLVLAATVVLVCGGLWLTREGRVGGARRGGCRRRPACHGGTCRRGTDTPCRVSREEMVEMFVAGTVTLDEMRKHYEGRTR